MRTRILLFTAGTALLLAACSHSGSGPQASTDKVIFTATPPSVSACDVTAGVTRITLNWDARPAGASHVRIRINSDKGQVFAEDAAHSTAETGDWVSNGLMFYLQDMDTGRTLSTLKYQFTPCPQRAAGS